MTESTGKQGHLDKEALPWEGKITRFGSLLSQTGALIYGPLGFLGLDCL